MTSHRMGGVTSERGLIGLWLIDRKRPSVRRMMPFIDSYGMPLSFFPPRNVVGWIKMDVFCDAYYFWPLGAAETSC